MPHEAAVMMILLPGSQSGLAAGLSFLVVGFSVLQRFNDGVVLVLVFADDFESGGTTNWAVGLD